MAKQPGRALHDGQSQPQALAAVAFGVAQLMEFPEDAFLLMQGYARAAVPDLHAQRVAVAAAADQHAAALGVMDGVVDQVAQDAVQQRRVRRDRGRERAHAQAQRFCLRLRRELVMQAIEHVGDRHRLHLRTHHARVQPREVEQAIEQAAQRLHRARDAVHQLSALRGQRMPLQHADEQAQRMHGLAQVVAGGRQEARLGQVAAFGRHLRPAAAAAGPGSRSAGSANPAACDACDGRRSATRPGTAGPRRPSP